MSSLTVWKNHPDVGWDVRAQPNETVTPDGEPEIRADGGLHTFGRE